MNHDLSDACKGQPATSRICVRINRSLSQLLGRRCQQTSQSLSAIVRSGLELALGSETQERHEELARAPVAPSVYVFPRELQHLLPGYRAFGMEAVRERRRCFGALLAVCEVVREHTGNRQDRALCAELLQIGRRFGPLR